jgi:hypothetical protein
VQAPVVESTTETKVVVHTVAIQSRDVQLVQPVVGPCVLATLNGVTRKVNRPETGTIFRLAKGEGHRHPST